MKTILFVDDEDYLVDVGIDMLEDYGYAVDAETDPKRALALFKSDPDRYGLLITDYTMPELTGVGLAEAIRDERPDLSVIMCSGTRLEPEIEACVSKVLLKPYDMELLISAVREFLDDG